jgi:hypothetical protein
MKNVKKQTDWVALRMCLIYIVQFQMFNYITILKGHHIHNIHHIVIF